MMKKIFYFALIGILGLPACTDMLDEDNKVQISSDYVFSTPDGLRRGAIALYNLERSMVKVSNAGLFCAVMFDAPSDIMVGRAGGGIEFFRSNYESPNELILAFWTNRYNIIGKTNEIIAGAERLGLDDPIVKQAWGEAKLFRARMYWDLYQRFGRLYLNTEPTTIYNIDRIFTPAKTEDIFQLINDDLDDAMGALEWQPESISGKVDYGRMTRTIAKHVKAQVAMWLEDWDEAIRQCEEIFTQSGYDMEESAIKNFTGADLNTMENLYVMQWSESETGGAGVGTTGGFIGHHMSLHTTPAYRSVPGLASCKEYGGYGWGRHFPNMNLFAHYDKVNDKRYKELFRHEYVFIDATILPAGKQLGDVATCPTAYYMERLHPSTLKYFDQWTNADAPGRDNAFKDIVIYRLAETYLMAAESRMRRYGGSDTKALEYYNETYARAGNTPHPGPLTIGDIIDEDARECHFEGTRYRLLKRLGILKERVVQYAGEAASEVPGGLMSDNFIQPRTNFKDKHLNWPIPSSELDKMGRGNFPQTEGWD